MYAHPGTLRGTQAWVSVHVGARKDGLKSQGGRQQAWMGSPEEVKGEITHVAHLSSPQALMACSMFTELSYINRGGGGGNTELQELHKSWWDIVLQGRPDWIRILNLRPRVEEGVGAWFSKAPSPASPNLGWESYTARLHCLDAQHVSCSASCYDYWCPCLSPSIYYPWGPEVSSLCVYFWQHPAWCFLQLKNTTNLCGIEDKAPAFKGCHKS